MTTWNTLVLACTCAGALQGSHLAQAGLKMLHHRGPGLHSPAWNWLQLHQSGVIRLWPQGPWADPRGPGLDVQGHWWCQRGEDAHKSLALLTRIPRLTQRGTDELTVFPHQHACITWRQLALTGAGTRDLCWIALDSYNCLNLLLRPTAVRPAFCTSVALSLGYWCQDGQGEDGHWVRPLKSCLHICSDLRKAGCQLRLRGASVHTAHCSRVGGFWTLEGEQRTVSL